MAPISSALPGTSVNTDRIAVSSKQRSAEADAAKQEDFSISQSSAFRREVPITRSSDFVEIDGKRYFLNAPRGTYLNILV